MIDLEVLYWKAGMIRAKTVFIGEHLSVGMYSVEYKEVGGDIRDET